MNPEDRILELNQLIQEPEFIKLRDLLQSKFNIFQFFGIETREISYSKLISRLLDPFANHGLGDIFLKEFLKSLIRDSERYKRFKELKIEYIDIDCAVFDDISIFVEKTIVSKKARIDILLELHIENERWILAIENKIFSKESPEQTITYAQELSQRYLDDKTKLICIFLTPQGDIPSSDIFLSYSWEEVYQILKIIQERSDITDDIRLFLNQFSDSIEVFIMDNPRLNELCEKLFNKYPDVLDFLLKRYSNYQQTPGTELISLIEKELKEKYQKEWEFFSGSNWIKFFKKEWKDIQDKNNWVKAKTQYFSLITFHCELTDKNDLRLYFYSYGYDPEDLRRKFKDNFMSRSRTVNSPYNKYLSTNLNVRNMFNFPVVKDLDQKSEEDIVKSFLTELDKIFKDYIPIFDDLIKNL